MILSNLFGGSSNEEATQDDLLTVQEEEVVNGDDAKAVAIEKGAERQKMPDDKPQTVVYDYSTNFPIDAIYAYIGKDWESIGHSDAFKNTDINYMNMRTRVIDSNLQLRFDMVRNQYNAKIKELKGKIDQLKAFGLVSEIVETEVDVQQCQDHLDKITEMETKLKENHPSMTIMVDAYKAGFTIGVAQILKK